MEEDVKMGSSGGYDFSSYQVKLKTKIGEFIATFPAGWSPQMVVKRLGIPPQNGRNIQIKDL